MSSDNPSPSSAPLDVSRWRNLPWILIGLGVVGVAIGVGASEDHVKAFGFSWLVAFMFFLSLGLGGWFLVMVHHLFDASWSVPIRRITEAMACTLAPALLVLFLPVAFLAPHLYPWLHPGEQMHTHAVVSKYPLFTMPGYYVSAAIVFALWWLFSNRLRYWSLQQDKDGAAVCTHKMRFYSALGVVVFALSVTLAAAVWMMGLMDEWYSTMYGVTYFAGSVWLALPTVYIITLVLDRNGTLKGLITEKTYYMIGSLFLAFTVFYAYVNFAQYFIIWNANMPEETFYFNLREVGSWDYVGKYIIIFGHFFLPFLMLLRIDFKLKIATMLPLTIWAWFMHFMDMQFQIMPVYHTEGIMTVGLVSDIGCMLLFAGILAKVFIASFNRYPPYPLKDPRMSEALEVQIPLSTDIAVAPTRHK